MKLKPYLDKVSGEYITEGLTPQDGADSISDFDEQFKVFFDNVGRPTKTSYAGWCSEDIKQYIQTKIDQEVKKVQQDNEILVNTLISTLKEDFRESLKRKDNTPMGASKWKELGVKYGYYEYFRKEEVKKVLEEIKNDISKNSDKKLNFGWSMNDCEYGCMNEILNLIESYLK